MLHIAAPPRSKALAPFIRSYHYHEAALPPAIERILPTGQAHLMVNLEEDEFRTYSGPHCENVHRSSGAVLSGPHGKTVTIDTMEQGRLIAVEFKIGGVAPFFPMPADETCDQVLSLRDVWGRDGGLVREQLCAARTPAEKLRVLEAVLLAHLVRPSDPAVSAAISLLEDGARIRGLCSQIGLLPKTLVRRFRSQVGLPPKRLSRVRRLQRIVASVKRPLEVDWCAVAAEHGYSDQAHLIHDFRDLTGMTPTAYRPSSPQRRNHVPLELLRG
jgi:AraC-like DNA-binding protein